MNISSSNYNTPSFKARNAEIRLADDIMRRANQEFIKFSPTKMYSLIYDKQQNIPKPILEKLAILQKHIKALRNARENLDSNADFYIKKLLFDVKVTKLGNCGESGSISKIACAVNGIDAKKVSLYGFKGKNKMINLDHNFVIVNLDKNADLSDYRTFGKKAYVIDLWDGIVDYVPNVFNGFKHSYASDVRMGAIDTFGVISNDFEIAPSTLNQIKKAFPNLIINKK